MRSLASLALTLTVSLTGTALLPTQAFAGDQTYVPMPPASPAPVEQPTPRSWYGGELLLSDMASIALISVGGSIGDVDGDAVATVGGTALVFAPAFIHGAHGNFGGAVGSVALRVGLPTLGLLAGEASCDESEHEDDFFGCLGPAMGGFLLGGITAMLIDDFALAWKDAPASSQQARGHGYQVGLAPRANGGMTLSFGGSF